MISRIGQYTINIESCPRILAAAAAVGKKEGEGPLGGSFDKINDDTTMGKATWERSESALQGAAVQAALDKASISAAEINYILAGDLLNQCIGSTYGLCDFSVPLIGMFGACSTMALTLATAAVLVDSGAADKCVAVTSSHFCSAERQFRMPLEYGGQRSPTAQWTVTGAGAAVVGKGEGISINNVTYGKIIDYGIKDANNMGAAMAPAAADTIMNYLKDTRTKPNDYDLILTGDLGLVGSNLLRELMKNEGVNLGSNYNDCGLMIFNPEKDDTHAGGSGCGCSASVLCGHIIKEMQKSRLKNILFCATGALMSPTASLQGETIPSIAHLINLSV